MGPWSEGRPGGTTKDTNHTKDRGADAGLGGTAGPAGGTEGGGHGPGFVWFVVSLVSVRFAQPAATLVSSSTDRGLGHRKRGHAGPAQGAWGRKPGGAKVYVTCSPSTPVAASVSSGDPGWTPTPDATRASASQSELWIPTTALRWGPLTLEICRVTSCPDLVKECPSLCHKMLNGVQECRVDVPLMTLKLPVDLCWPVWAVHCECGCYSAASGLAGVRTSQRRWSWPGLRWYYLSGAKGLPPGLPGPRKSTAARADGWR